MRTRAACFSAADSKSRAGTTTARFLSGYLPHCAQLYTLFVATRRRKMRFSENGSGTKTGLSEVVRER